MKKNTAFHFQQIFYSCMLLLILTPLDAQEIDWDKPPPPRPNDPRLELQPVFDGNGVVYDWKAYILNPVTKEKKEIIIEERERFYRIADNDKSNFWTISLKLYTALDRPSTKPQGARVCLKDIEHPAGSQKPHFEIDLSGQITVALTLDCPEGLAPKSIYDTKVNPSTRALNTLNFSNGNRIIAATKNSTTSSIVDDCLNCVFVENSSFTHPDRAGGPDVASHSDRTLYAFREIVNEIRIYQQSAISPATGERVGFAYAWQGSRTNPAVSVGLCRHDPEDIFGVVFTIPRGFVYPNVEGTIKRVGGLTAFLRETQREDEGSDKESDGDDNPPPPVTP